MSAPEPLIENAIFERLRDDPGVKTIVGDKIFPQSAPQAGGEDDPDKAKLPRVTYQLISSNHFHNADGASRLANPLFQLNCVSKTYGEAKELANCVRRALQGFRGTVAGVVIQGIFLSNQRDEFVISPSGSEQRARIVQQDYTIFNQESSSPV